MFLLDVNIVLGAQRVDHPQHPLLRKWFDDVVASSEDFAVPMAVWASFLRLTTNRRIFKVPTPLATAFDFMEAVRAQPNHLDVAPGPRHAELLRHMCEETGASGDLIPDAVIASIAQEHSCTVATLDRDFARFDKVRHLILKV